MKRPETLRWLVALVAAIVLAGCGGDSGSSAAVGGNAGPSGGAAASRPPVIRMAFVPSLNQQTVVRSGNALAKLLEPKTGLKYQVSVLNSYSAVVEALGAGQLDIAWLNPLSYVVAHDRYGVQVHLGTVRNGSQTYRGLIIVRKDSPIKSLKDLKGKRFGFVDPLSTSGSLYPKSLMMDHGIDPARDLTATDVGGHDKAIIAVIEKQVDAASIYGGEGGDARDRVRDSYPNVYELTRVIAETDPIPNDTVCARKDLDPELVRKVMAALEEVVKSDEGRRQLLEGYDIDDLRPVKDDIFDPIRKVARAMNIDLGSELEKQK
jgi:phosphonate transport system substrate-binding protein